MSLEIRTEQVTGVYALGQWYSVLKGSFKIDAYELIEDFDGAEGDGTYQNIYQLGNVYESSTCTKELPGNGIPGTFGENWFYKDPSGMQGCQWIDPYGAQVLISMSILEIKAWRIDNVPSKSIKPSLLCDKLPRPE